MKYESAIHTMVDFICCDEEIKKIQEESSLKVQNARFEMAYSTFLPRFLEQNKGLEASTVACYSNYKL